MGNADELRARAAGIVQRGGEVSTESQEEYQKLLNEWADAGEDENDAVVRIGLAVYSCQFNSKSGPKEEEKIEFFRIDFDYLQGFMKDVLLEYGVPEKEAQTSSEVLICADKHGVDSHGIGRLKPIYCDRMDAGILKAYAEVTVVKETETTALIDGNGGLGLYVGPFCMNMALEKAKKHGIAMVVARNSTHYGMAGYYPLVAADHGCFGVTGTNARPSIAPTYGVEPMLGTNPITWSFPTDESFPFLLDCATSVTQRGKIEQYEREGKPTPPGQVVDRDGRVRTDTSKILEDLVTGQCSLAPLGGVGSEMGGYKGYGYATVTEILSSALQSGNTSPFLGGVDKETGKKAPMLLGHWFIVVDIERFLPLSEFKTNVGNLLRMLRDSAKDPTGPGRVWTAGEVENDKMQERLQNGGAPIPKALMKDMVALREKFPKLQEKYEKFPFE